MIKQTRILATFIVLMLIMSFSFGAHAQVATPIKVYVDGSYMSFTKAPYYSSKQLYIEFDTVYKKLGYKITTNKNTITYTKKGYSNKMVIGKNYVYVNGKKKSISVPVHKIGKKVYVPVIAVPITTDKAVRWNKSKTAIFIEVKNPAIKVIGNVTSLSLEKGVKKNLDVFSSQTMLKDEDVVWRTSNSKIATVDSKGYLTALNKGNASITISIPGHTSSYKLNVTVTPKKVKKVTIPNKTVRLVKGEKQTFQYTVSPADAEGYQILWSSSDNGVVEVNDKGEITAVKTGTATINASLQGSSSIFATSVVTVVPKAIEKLTLPAELNVVEGQKLMLPYTVAPADAEGYKLKWSSTNTEVATVNSDGEIQGIKPGTTYITARVENSHIYAAINITVTERIISLEEVKGSDGPTLQKYLNQHYKELMTPLGDWKPEFSARKSGNEIDITIGWGGVPSPYVLKYDDESIEKFHYGRILTAQEKIETKQLLRAFMKEVGADIFNAFPGNYVKAQFYTGGYKYPHIKVGYWSTSFLTWDNGVERGNQLHWDPKLDDYNFVLDQELTDLSVVHPQDGKTYGSKDYIPYITIKKGEKIKLQLIATPVQDISQYSFKELGFRPLISYNYINVDDNGYIEGKQVGKDALSLHFGDVYSLYIPIQVIE
ncbi:Ig domain-containing protein [Peribacillus asahii]|uniref:Ig-like domain-containing protein n=1 Tax=Peribacillus asahii TaxID=228899 RepID=UPI00381A18CD